MNKYIYNAVIALAAALALGAGCSREPMRADSQAETVLLSLNAELTVSTKAPSAQLKEESIDSLQAFIFSSDGLLESSRRARTNALEISCLKGEKIIWVLVNCPAVELEAGSPESALSGYALDLKDNAMGSLMMSGRVVKDIQEGGSLSVPVDRLPSKVRLGTVMVDFNGTSLEGASFILKDVYVRNVAGSVSVDGTQSPAADGLWYNKFVDCDAAAGHVLHDVDLNRAVANASPELMELSYLVFPNPTADDDNAAAWSARRTHLVLHATVNGEDTWYPIVLPVIGRNRIYNVKTVTLTMKGNDHPEDPPITTSSLSLNISINPWTGEDEITYTL